MNNGLETREKKKTKTQYLKPNTQKKACFFRFFLVYSPCISIQIDSH